MDAVGQVGVLGGRKRFGWAEFLGMGCGLAKTNGFRFCKMILCEALANVLSIVPVLNETWKWMEM